MPGLPTLIAHYLGTTYPAALPAFLAATKEPPPDLSQPPVPDLRTVAQDYLSHSLAAKFGEVGLRNKKTRWNGSWEGWTAREVAKMPMRDVGLRRTDRCVQGLSLGNMLGVKIERVPRRRFDTASASYHADYPRSILVTSVDKTLSIVDFDSGEVDRIIEPHRSAILSFALHPTQPRYLLTGAMDGSTVLTDLITSTPLQSFRSTKYVVRVAFSQCGRYMATASYDKNIVIYRAVEGTLRTTRTRSTHAVHSGSEGEGDETMEESSHSLDTDTTAYVPPQTTDTEMEQDVHLDVIDDTDDVDLAVDPELRYEEVHRIKVDFNPEALLFIPPVRRDPVQSGAGVTAGPTATAPATATSEEPTENTAYLLYTTRSSHYLHYVSLTNFAHLTKSFNAHPLDNHVSFSVLNLVLHPSGNVVACQTDHGGAGERVLLYSTDPHDTERLACLWTGAETDDYALPRLAWLEDGTGLITTSPTGQLHLLSLTGESRSVKVHGGDNISGVVRDVDVVGDTVVSVGYDRVVRFSEIA